MRALLESIPLILAMVVLLAVMFRWQTIKTRNGRALVMWMALNAVIMMMAQSSWWYTVLVLNSNQGEDVANLLWTVFNSSVMAFYIAAASLRLNDER